MACSIDGKRILCLLVFWFSLPVCAKLTVVDGGGQNTTYDTSTFIYLGAPAKSQVFLNDVEAAYLVGSDVCDPLSSRVKGKVILVDWQDDVETLCGIGEAYLGLDAAGALALIYIAHYSPPGMLSYYHSTWDTSLYSDRRMMMVDISWLDLGASPYEDWEATGVRVSLGPPHVRVFQDAFGSPAWLLTMQVLLPLTAFHTCFLCVAEIVRLRRSIRLKAKSTQPYSARDSSRILTLMILVLEVPSIFLIGLLLVFGEYGPFMLPFRIHFCFYLLLSGTMVSTSLLTALLMHEESRAAEGLTYRPVLSQNRITITVILVIFVGSEIVYSIGMLLDDDITFFQSSQRVLLAVFAIFLVVQGASAIYFIVQARALRKSLIRIISLPATKQHPQNEKKLRRLSFWLVVAGGLSINSTITSLMTAAGVAGMLGGATTGFGYLLNFFNFSASRILVSYAQIHVLKPSTPSFYACLCARIDLFLVKRLRQPALTRVVRPSNRRVRPLVAGSIPLKKKSAKFVGFADELEEVFFFDKHEPPGSRLQPLQTPITLFDATAAASTKDEEFGSSKEFKDEPPLVVAASTERSLGLVTHEIRL